MEKQILIQNNSIVLKFLIYIFSLCLLFTACNTKTDCSKPIVLNSQIELSSEETKILKEAYQLNDCVLKQQKAFVCLGCEVYTDTLIYYSDVDYSNLLLQQLVVKNDDYICIEFWKYVKFKGKLRTVMFHENNPSSIFKLDVVFFLYDKKNRRWDYIGEKLGKQKEVIMYGHNDFLIKRYKNVIKSENLSLMRVYNIENLNHSEVSDYVVNQNNDFMREYMSNLSECIIEKSWWSAFPQSPQLNGKTGK